MRDGNHEAVYNSKMKSYDTSASAHMMAIAKCFRGMRNAQEIPDTSIRYTILSVIKYLVTSWGHFAIVH